jgi:hypothetical protein
MDVAEEVHSLHGFDYVLVHFDPLLLSPDTIVVYARGFEEAKAIQGRKLKDRFDSFPVIASFENGLGSIVKILNVQLLSPFFSLGEVFRGESLSKPFSSPLGLSEAPYFLNRKELGHLLAPLE